MSRLETYYALVENERIELLGTYASMSEADDANTDKQIVWMMTENAIKQLRTDIDKLIPRTMLELPVFIGESELKTFKDVVYSEAEITWYPRADTGEVIEVTFYTSDGEHDEP